MPEVYVLVEKKQSMGFKVARIAVLILAIASLIINFAIPLFLIVPLILFLVWGVMQFLSYREFEYSYYDGTLRFTKIRNKSSRKALMEVSMENVLVIAPKGDRSLMSYHQNGATVKNYTSHDSEANYYEVVVNTENGTTCIMIEPDEKFLEAVCIKYRQKVVTA